MLGGCRDKPGMTKIKGASGLVMEQWQRLQMPESALFCAPMKIISPRLLILAALLSPLALAACDTELSKESDIVTPGDTEFPNAVIDRQRSRQGKLTGSEGITLGGAGDEDGTGGNNPLGVNSFLWRATLDTLAFLPLASPDPFGGVITTDWYEDPEARGERFKVNALILDRRLSSSSLKITVFRQTRNKAGQWEDAAVDATMGRKLEDTVLTRARQMRVTQLGY